MRQMGATSDGSRPPRIVRNLSIGPISPLQRHAGCDITQAGSSSGGRAVASRREAIAFLSRCMRVYLSLRSSLELLLTFRVPGDQASQGQGKSEVGATFGGHFRANQDHWPRPCRREAHSPLTVRRDGNYRPWLGVAVLSGFAR